jgi:hypothetical protein
MDITSWFIGTSGLCCAPLFWFSQLVFSGDTAKPVNCAAQSVSFEIPALPFVRVTPPHNRGKRLR